MSSQVALAPNHAPSAVTPPHASVVVIEDDVLLADLLRMALQLRLKPAALQLFQHGRAGLEYCQQTQPDLLIVDLGLPDMDGRQVIRRMHALCPSTRILVLTGQVTTSLPAELLSLGVAGYVDKGSSLEHIDTAVKRVLEGGIYLSAGKGAAPERLAGRLPHETEITPEILSEREREIVRFVGRGLISKEIGVRLDLSPRTVEKARARILQKLNVRDLPSLVRWSVQHGLS